jgi:hypothetical protein
MLRRKPQQHVIERAKIEVSFFWWGNVHLPHDAGADFFVQLSLGVSLRAGLSCKSTEPQARLRPSGFNPITRGGDAVAPFRRGRRREDRK